MSYDSPRLTSEFYECGLPFTFDHISKCSFSCGYCREPDALMWRADLTWARLGDVRVGDQLMGFERTPNQNRHYAVATVEQVLTRKSPIVALHLESGRVIRCTPDHHWYTGRIEPQFEYQVPKVGRPLIRVHDDPKLSFVKDNEYRLGYVRGLVEGDGSFTDKVYSYATRDYNVQNVRVAMNDEVSLARFAEYCTDLGLQPRTGTHDGGDDYNSAMPCIRLYGQEALNALVYGTESWTDSYMKGWLAGIFDAEGSISECLRISQYPEVNPATYAKIGAALARLEFQFKEEPKGIRLLGGRKEILRFHSTVLPANVSKFHNHLLEARLLGERDQVLKIEKCGEADVISLKTSTGNYISDGFASRNCFAGPIKDAARDAGGYPDLDTVNVERFKKLFTAPKEELSQEARWIREGFIDNRLILHWGGLADPFDKRSLTTARAVTLELLRFLTEIKYPVLFSTKGVFYKDAELLEVFRANVGRWGVQHSIITYDADIAKAVERGVGNPQERVKTQEALSKTGVHTILRFRPFSPGVSTGTWRQLITASADAGTKGISTEFLCIPFPDFEHSQKVFKKMGEAADFDLVGIYTAISDRKRGQPRLTREWKKPYVMGMYEETHIKRGWTFACSDPDFKELNDTDGCCGVFPGMLEGGELARGQYTTAIRHAFRHGTVRWELLEKEAAAVLSGFPTVMDPREKNSAVRRLKQESFYDRLKSLWNQPKNKTISPVNFFGKTMIPCGMDSAHNLVYAFDYVKALYTDEGQLIRMGVQAGGLKEFRAQRAGKLPGEATGDVSAPYVPAKGPLLPVLGE